MEHVRLEEAMMDLTGGVTESISLQNLYSAPAMKQVLFFEQMEKDLIDECIVIFCTKVSYIMECFIIISLNACLVYSISLCVEGRGEGYVNKFLPKSLVE